MHLVRHLRVISMVAHGRRLLALFRPARAAAMLHRIVPTGTEANDKLVSDWTGVAHTLTTCADLGARDRLLDTFAQIERPTVVAFLNAHACNLSRRLPEFREALLAADYVLRDGVGVELLLTMQGRPSGINLNGSDLIPLIVERFTELGTIGLYGTRMPELATARDTLRRNGAVIDTLHGFHETEHYVERARATRPRLIVLGMGMPKQELLSIALRDALDDDPILIVNGGAIIDFYAGRYPRAPQAVRRARLEWLWRLTREPRRLWRRNLGSSMFLARSCRAAAGEWARAITDRR